MATAVLCGLLAIAYAVVTVTSPWARAALSGSSFYPLLVAGVLMIGAVGTGLELVITRASEGETVEWPVGKMLLKVLAVGVACLGYASLLNVLGHPIASFLVCLITMQALGTRSWVVKLLIAAAMAVGSQYIFSTLLEIPLPMGFLGD